LTNPPGHLWREKWTALSGPLSQVYKEPFVGKASVSKMLAEVKEMAPEGTDREFFIDNLLVRIHFIIVMIRWIGLAPWEFEFPFPGSLPSTFLDTAL